jgi:hypothetical protein
MLTDSVEIHLSIKCKVGKLPFRSAPSVKLLC